MSERNLNSLNKAQLIEEIEQLRNSDAGKVIAELQDKAAILEAEKAEAAAAAEAGGANKEEVEGYKQLIAELQEQNRLLTLTKGNPNGLYTEDGVTYQIMAGVTVKEGKLSAAELLARPDVCARLVKMGSAIMQRLEL